MTSRIFVYAGARASSSRDADDVGSGVEGDVAQRVDVVGKARGSGLAGHAPDDGAGFVLDVDAAAFFAHGLRAEYAVGTHAGEHDGEGVGAERGGDGAEEKVDGGAGGVFRS